MKISDEDILISFVNIFSTEFKQCWIFITYKKDEDYWHIRHMINFNPPL